MWHVEFVPKCAYSAVHLTGVVVVSSHCVLPRRCAHKEGDIGRIEGSQLTIQEASSEGQYHHTTVYHFHNVILYSNDTVKGL